MTDDAPKQNEASGGTYKGKKKITLREVCFIKVTTDNSFVMFLSAEELKKYERI